MQSLLHIQVVPQHMRSCVVSPASLHNCQRNRRWNNLLRTSSRHLSICTVRLEGLAHATPPHCLHGPELAVIEGRLFSQKEEHKISYDWLIGMACAQLVLELVG